MSQDDLGAALTSLWATVDPVPVAARQAATEAIGWRELDGELARLTSDAGLEREVAHVRGEAARLLSFVSGAVTVDLEISGSEPDLRLLGQLDPPAGADVLAESTDWSRPTRADAHGRYGISRLPAGRMRLVVAFDDAVAERTVTEWFTV